MVPQQELSFGEQEEIAWIRNFLTFHLKKA